jgi:hypothetical protein
VGEMPRTLRSLMRLNRPTTLRWWGNPHSSACDLPLRLADARAPRRAADGGGLFPQRSSCVGGRHRSRTCLCRPDLTAAFVLGLLLAPGVLEELREAITPTSGGNTLAGKNARPSRQTLGGPDVGSHGSAAW